MTENKKNEVKIHRPNKSQQTDTQSVAKVEETVKAQSEEKKEVGGRQGPEPTRYGDWEKNGRCVDF